jgi:nicotinamide riboside kinase
MKENKECLVVNIIGGPGTGKSILASEVFSKLKRDGVTCDVAWEYIKRKLREKALKVVQSQLYLFGKQQFQLFTMKDEVEVVITDAPLLLFSYYDKTRCPYLRDMVINEYNKYNNLLYFIERDLSVEYETEGRYQDLEGAKEVDIELRKFLDDNNIQYKLIKGIGSNSLETITNDIKNKLTQ